LNLFELVKSNITVKQAAEKYCQPLSRNGMMRCPFHDDHTPSLKLNDTYYYCFGCGAKGDVIDFTVKLFGLTLHEAAQKLAADFGFDPNTPPAVVSVKLHDWNTDTTKAHADWPHCQRVLLECLQILKEWQAHFAPRSPDDLQDLRFVLALRMHDEVEHLLDCLEVAAAEERAEKVEDLYTSGTISFLESLIHSERKEAADDQERRTA